MIYKSRSFSQRNYEVVEHRVAGWTLRAIGEKFGISSERVRQICREAMRIGIFTREEIKKTVTLDIPNEGE